VQRFSCATELCESWKVSTNGIQDASQKTETHRKRAWRRDRPGEARDDVMNQCNYFVCRCRGKVEVRARRMRVSSR
jgi:hypothetical protein